MKSVAVYEGLGSHKTQSAYFKRYLRERGVGITGAGAEIVVALHPSFSEISRLETHYNTIIVVSDSDDERTIEAFRVFPVVHKEIVTSTYGLEAAADQVDEILKQL